MGQLGVNDEKKGSPMGQILSFFSILYFTNSWSGSTVVIAYA